MLFFMPHVAFNQTTSFTCAVQDNHSCPEAISVYATVGPLTETGGIVTIQWGDGQTQTVNYVTRTGQSLANLYFPHDYAAAGNYTVTVSIYSGRAGAQAGPPQSFTILANEPGYCGQIWLRTMEIFPNTRYEGVTYDFTGQNGVTQTLTAAPNSGAPEFVIGLKQNNAPYTVSINDAWLASHGLRQMSPDITITGFNADGIANPSVADFEVDCAVADVYPDIEPTIVSASSFNTYTHKGNVTLQICNHACNNRADVDVWLEYPVAFVPNITGLPNASVANNFVMFKIPALRDCATFTIPFTFPETFPPGTGIGFNATVFNPDESNFQNNTRTGITTIYGPGFPFDSNEKSLQEDTAAEEIVSIFPNPAGSFVRLGGTVNTVQVYDLTGNLLIDLKEVNNNEFSVANLADGSYQIVINGMQAQQLMIRK